MAKKLKRVTIPFDCPCHRKLSLFKCFDVVDKTPPEKVVTECPECEKQIKLALEHHLDRTDAILREFKIKSITLT